MKKEEWMKWGESTEECRPPLGLPQDTQATYNDQRDRRFFTGNCSGLLSLTRDWLAQSPWISSPLPQTVGCNVSVFLLSFANSLEFSSPVSSNDLAFGETLSLPALVLSSRQLLHVARISSPSRGRQLQIILESARLGSVLYVRNSSTGNSNIIKVGLNLKEIEI